MCLHSPPLLDSYLKREKNCFSLKVPSDIQRAFSFTRLLDTMWHYKRGLSVIFLKGHFKILNHFLRVLNFKIMLKCFCPVVFRLEWLSAFCEIFKRCFLSFPAKVFKVFLSKLFRYLQVLRNYLLSKNISVSKSIIWLSHQVVIYFPDFTFFLNFLHKSAFPFHFTFHKFQYFCATSLAQFGTKYTSTR